MICIVENAEINGIESSTEIKQNKDSNLLLVHHDIQQNTLWAPASTKLRHGCFFNFPLKVEGWSIF